MTDSKASGFKDIVHAVRSILNPKLHSQMNLDCGEELFRATFDHAAIGMAIGLPDKTILQVNRAFEEMLGYGSGELAGAHRDVLTHPEDRELTDAGYDEIIRTMAPRRTYEKRYMRKDGGTIWVHVSTALLYNNDGSLKFVITMAEDITARKEAQEKLRESETRYRMLYENLRDAFVQVDMDGRIILFNDLYSDMLGYSEEEVRSLTYQELTPERWHEFEEKIVQEQILPRGYSDVYEKEYRKKDGTVFPVELRTILLRDDAGRPHSMWGMVRDITQRKQAEQSLRESEERFRLFMDNAPTSAWIKDEEGRYTYVSRVSDASRGEALGKTDFDIYPRDIAVQLRENDLAVMTSDRAGLIVEEFDNHEGSRSVWLNSKFPITVSGRRYTAGIGIDITKRKLAEDELHRANERLSALMNALPVGVSFSDDATCQRITGNPAGLAQFGVSPNDNLSASAPDPSAPGRKVRFHLGNREIADAELPLQRAVRENREIGPMELRVERPDGRVWFAEASGAPVRDKQGRVIGGIAVTLDVTESKRSKEELRHLAAERERLLDSERAARAAAEKATRVKDDFLATLSHELRTPLNAVLGWTTILKRKPEDLEKGLGVIERNARAQAQLIEDLLDMNRIYSGKLDIEKDEISVPQIIGDAIETVETSIREKGLSLSVSLEPVTKLMIGDAARLRQAFLNLLANAVKFTPEGGQISVLLEEKEDWAELVVRDNGEGIGHEFLAFIFDRFSQGDVSMNKKKHGLGLGLAISKAVVELHGGTIEASSPGKGQGAAFTVRLPLQALGRDIFANSPDKALLALPEGLTILLVEDEIDSLEFMQHLLEERGARVRAASSGAEALEILAEETPDLIVSDISMPGMDGYSLIRQIRALPGDRRDIPAIAVTAYAREMDKEKAFEAGFTAHIAKPINPPHLLHTIAALHRDYAAASENAVTLVM